MLGDPFQRAGDRIGKALHHVRVLPDVRLRGEVGRVRDLAALLPDGREDISLARLRDLGGRRLKERDKIAVAAGERPGHHVELHRRIHIGIRAGDNAVLPHDVFERHLRHAARAPADDRPAAQQLPRKRHILSPDEKRPVALRELAEHDRVIVLALIVHIDARLRSGETDVRLPGEHRRHDLVGAAAVGQLDLQPLVREKPLLQRHVLRRVEHRMCHLAQADGGRLLRAAGAQGHQQQYRQNPTKKPFHCVTPNRFLNPFSSHSTS